MYTLQQELKPSIGRLIDLLDTEIKELGSATNPEVVSASCCEGAETLGVRSVTWGLGVVKRK